MNKSTLVIIVASALLVACGGGTPGAPPTVGPSATPTRTLSVGWSGQLHPTGGIGAAGSATGSAKRTAIGSTSGAILIVSGDSSSPTALGAPRGAVVEPQASPVPTTWPPTTFSSTLAQATLAPTPSPDPSASPTNAPPGMVIQPGTSNASGTGVVTIAIPSLGLSATMNAIDYPMLTLDCLGRDPNEHIGGVRWSGTAWVDEPDPTQADLYWTAPVGACTGAFLSVSTEPQLNYPGGGKWYDSTNSLDLFTTADWSNAGTSATRVQLGSIIPGGGPESEQYATLIGHTLPSHGSIPFKFFPVSVNGSSVAGAIEVHGQGLDSF